MACQYKAEVTAGSVVGDAASGSPGEVGPEAPVWHGNKPRDTLSGQLHRAMDNRAQDGKLNEFMLPP